MPALRLVGDDQQLSYPEPKAGWSTEPETLLALAVALEPLVGEAPDHLNGMSPELEAWFERHGRAGDILAELSNGDSAMLRAAAPARPDIGDAPPGLELLLLAAIRIERRGA